MNESSGVARNFADTGDLTVGDTLTFDVTTIVQAGALGGTYSTFRLQTPGPYDNNSTADLYYFGKVGDNDAQLTLVPEPSTLALIFGAVALGTASLRRRNK